MNFFKKLFGIKDKPKEGIKKQIPPKYYDAPRSKNLQDEPRPYYEDRNSNLLDPLNLSSPLNPLSPFYIGNTIGMSVASNIDTPPQEVTPSTHDYGSSTGNWDSSTPDTSSHSSSDSSYSSSDSSYSSGSDSTSSDSGSSSSGMD